MSEGIFAARVLPPTAMYPHDPPWGKTTLQGLIYGVNFAYIVRKNAGDEGGSRGYMFIFAPAKTPGSGASLVVLLVDFPALNLE